MNIVRLYFIFFLIVAIFLGVIFFSPPAESKEYGYFGGWSYHFSKKDYHNETHSLFAYRNNGYMVGTFVNSHDDRSYIVSKAITVAEGNNLSFSINIGLVYGYYNCAGGDKTKSDNHQRICPAFNPELSYTKYKWQPSILGLGNAVAIALKREF